MRTLQWLALMTAVLVIAGCGDKEKASSTNDDQATDVAADNSQSKPPSAPGTAADSTTKLAAGPAYVTADHVAAVVIRPKKILQHPMLKDVPMDFFTDSITEQAGIEPADIERLTILLGKALIPSPAGPPSEPTVVIQFAEPRNAQEVATGMFDEVTEHDLNGKKYYKAQAEYITAVMYQMDPTTVVMATEDDVKTIAAKGGEATALGGKLKELGDGDDIVFVAYPEMIKAELQQLAQMAPAEGPVGEYSKMAELLKSSVIRINLTGDTLIHAQMTGYNETAGTEMEQMASGGLAMAQQAFAGFRPQLASMIPGEDGEPLLKLADQFLAGISVSRNGSTVDIKAGLPPQTGETLAAILPALAAQAQAAAEQTQQANNLRQIGLAVHNYHDVYQKFPSGIRDDDGNLLLSWRVEILPFLGENELYEQFNLEESWDSDLNKMLVVAMPDVFATGESLDAGMTRLQSFQGAEGLHGDEPIKFSGIQDGTSNTIMFVETGPEVATPWTKPEGLEFDPKNPIAALGAVSPRGILAAFCDGSVRTIPADIDAEMLRRLINPKDGQPVDIDF